MTFDQCSGKEVELAQVVELAQECWTPRKLNWLRYVKCFKFPLNHSSILFYCSPNCPITKIPDKNHSKIWLKSRRHLMKVPVAWISPKFWTGWWFQPLWKTWKSIGMIIPNIWENKKWQPNHQPVNQSAKAYFPAQIALRTPDSPRE